MIALAVLVAQAMIPSTPSLGVAEGRCRPNEQGPAILVTVTGLKDRKGILRVEVYPANDDDFLADDNVLLSEGKVFRRAVAPVPANGTPRLCIRVPHAGTYALSVVHDRDGRRQFSLSHDGIGFAGNPKLGLSKPDASEARVVASAGLTPISVVMNYRRGLFSFGPLSR